MATPIWDTNFNQVHSPHDLENQFKPIWDSLQKSKESWKCEQRLSLFDSCELEKADQRIVDAKEINSFRQLQSAYEKAENQILQWRQMATLHNNGSILSQCNEFLKILIQNSCICVKQPPPIVDGDSKRSRPQVEIRLLAGKLSGVIQDGQIDVAISLLTEEQARNVVEGKVVPGSSEYSVEWHGKKPVTLTWDGSGKWFRARFNDVVLKKPAGHKWLDGYHLHFHSAVGKDSPTPPSLISCLSTPFEIVSNRTGQKPHKMRNEFWRLAFCTNDSTSTTVGLRSSVPGDPFLNIFDRWYRGFTGCGTGLNDAHKKSIAQMLKIRDGVVTWERFKKNWSFLYQSAEYVKENTFLWHNGVLNYCFTTREETEKLLSQCYEKTMLIRFQQSAPGYLSISFIMPAEQPDDGRYVAHFPLEIYFKRFYTLVQCIEFADLLSPTGRKLKSKLRDFKILGSADAFDYKQILDEDEKNREQIYASMQKSQDAAAGGADGEQASGPLVDYSSVKERFRIKTTKFPEDQFQNLFSPAFSVTPSSIGSPTPTSPDSVRNISPKNSITPEAKFTPMPQYQPSNHVIGAPNFGNGYQFQGQNQPAFFTGQPSNHASPPNFGMQMPQTSQFYGQNFQPEMDEQISDEDLKAILDACRGAESDFVVQQQPSFNKHAPTNVSSTVPSGMIQMQYPNYDYQIDDQQMMDYQMTDFMVPNR